MNKIGFSTGALAYGDFRRGIELQRCAGVEAIELSALREHELLDLLDAIGKLDLSSFAYRSFHAPSALREMTPIELIERLRPVAAMGLPIIVHPDVLGNNIDACAVLGESLLLENMDIPKAGMSDRRRDAAVLLTTSRRTILFRHRTCAAD